MKIQVSLCEVTKLLELVETIQYRECFVVRNTMTGKFDFKKEYKDLYLPKQKPMLVQVPAMKMLMIDGHGAPAGEDYQKAVELLYSVTFTIKMSKMQGKQPADYFESVVPPLESLWWSEGSALDLSQPKSTWLWTSMIRQPDFVTDEVYKWTLAQASKKKVDLDYTKLRFDETFEEGLCVQMLHVGPYDDEYQTLCEIEKYIENNDLIDVSGAVRKHHEIYLSDPRRVAPEKLKTVLRVPVSRKAGE